MNAVHKKALQKNHRLIINTLDLSGSDILDQLFQDDVISSGEQDDILARTTHRDQNTRLLFVLKRRGGRKNPFDKLLKALDNSYSFVAKELRSTAVKLEEWEDSAKACSYCMLLNSLIPSDISHFLYEEDVISDDSLEQLNNRNISRTERVRILLSLIEENPSKSFAFECFRKSLEPKYRYILSANDTFCVENYNHCLCSQKSNTITQVSECTAEGRTLTHPYEDTVTCIPIKGIPDENQEYKYGIKECLNCICEDEIDGYSVCSSNSRYLQLSDCAKSKTNDEVTLNSNFTSNSENMVAHVDSSCVKETNTTVDESSLHGTVSVTHDTTVKSEKHFEIIKEQKGKRHNRNEKQRKKLFTETSSKQSPGTETNLNSSSNIMQLVPKTSPNDKKLMRMCTRLWDKLFFLRERGEWDTFNLVSVRAFETFSSNPDIQVLLYRSEMCVSTFYSTDIGKACEMYQKAMDILPKTSIPTWHLARLLPLKMELCTREKKFEEAASLLEQAHQAIMTLGPCLSTGAVHFFEAIYLGNILRCTRNGTKSASIFERVKKCFLTAVEHYQHEQYFAIQSFLNQVYLFLALFSLGVDFKSIAYIGIHKVNEEDIALAEHYLNMFENNFWENSTNWSRMLFFIARGEQHKQRNNLNRCLDYYREARTCADKGTFVEHLEFVEENIQRLEEKSRENVSFELKFQAVGRIFQDLLDSSGESGSGEE